MERSCLKTLASKHKTTTRQIRKKYHDGHGWSIPAGSRKKPKRIGIIKFWDYPKKFYSDEIKEYRFYGYKSMLWKRIQKGVCELCNVRMERKGVVHMVRKLKDLGDRPWEQTMKRMRRKTLVVCHSCHNLIHANGWYVSNCGEPDASRGARPVRGEGFGNLPLTARRRLPTP